MGLTTILMALSHTAASNRIFPPLRNFSSCNRKELPSLDRITILSKIQNELL